MRIFWAIIFILSLAMLFIFVKKKKNRPVVSVVEEVPEKSSVLVKNVIIKFFHSQIWLAIVNNTEKALRRIRILFLKMDSAILNILDRVRGHSSKIVRTNLENQTSLESQVNVDNKDMPADKNNLL